jgi:hypothetical protein
MQIVIGGKKRFVVLECTIAEYEEASSAMMGICLACGEEADFAEPDARENPCEVCGKKKVMGVDEMLQEGLVDLTDEGEEEDEEDDEESDEDAEADEEETLRQADYLMAYPVGTPYPPEDPTGEDEDQFPPDPLPNPANPDAPN